VDIYNKNVPITSNQNVPLELLIPHLPRRISIKQTEIERLAVLKFNRSKKGITFQDLITKLGISKRKAQRKLKDCCKSKALFTLQHCKPQHYFPNSIRADVIEYFGKNQNVPVHPTEVTHSKTAISKVRESKAQTFLDVLCAFDNVPLYIHKLQLELFINPEGYKDLNRDSVKGNKAKLHEERIGKAYVKYLIYPNGKVMVYIACSNDPFKIESEADESVLFAFFGRVYDRLLYLLSDVRESIVPSIMKWRLVGCDINKDNEISDMMQLSAIDIQLKSADRVFRLYVKSLHDKAVYRCEESLALKNTPLIEALDNIKNPYKALENKIDCIALAVEKQLNTILSVSSCKAAEYNDINK
jgi:hypothetical protein